MENSEIMEDCVTFSSGENTLEGILAYPESGKPDIALLFIPPHPQMGGRMDNNVILHLAKRFAESGFITFRFNYHGIGNSTIDLSEGKALYQYWNEMESIQDYSILLEDAISAYIFLKSVSPDCNIIIVGYSLGAILSGQMLEKTSPHSVLAIAPPNAKAVLSGFDTSHVPKLVIVGDNDFAFDASTFASYFKQWPEPKKLVSLSDTDHFFRMEEESLFGTMLPYVSS